MQKVVISLSAEAHALSELRKVIKSAAAELEEVKPQFLKFVRGFKGDGGGTISAIYAVDFVMIPRMKAILKKLKFKTLESKDAEVIHGQRNGADGNSTVDVVYLPRGVLLITAWQKAVK